MMNAENLQYLLEVTTEQIFRSVVITISAAREIGASMLEQNGPIELIDALNVACAEALEAAKNGTFDEEAHTRLSAAMQPAVFWVLYPASRLQ